MPEPEKPAESSTDSLASVPPIPEEGRVPLLANISMGTISMAVAGAGAIVLIGGTLTPTVGATRSAKLEWQRRQQQIEQAVRGDVMKSTVDPDPQDQNHVEPNTGEHE
jgi:hypothetical protein